MKGQDPRVEKLTAAVYAIPTDQPEADGTLAWSKTTLVVAEAVAARRGGRGGARTAGIGALRAEPFRTA